MSKSISFLAKGRAPPTSSRLSAAKTLPANRSILKLKSQERATHIPSHLTSFQVLDSPANDEHSIVSTITHPLPTVDPEPLPARDKLQPDFQDNLPLSELSSRRYRTTHSVTSSSSTSGNSRDEPLLAPDTVVIGNLYILNELYPSIDHENTNGTPLAFLGTEKLLVRTRIDWTQVPYPLSAYHIELVIDLTLARPSFVREIPKVTQFTLYRPLTKTVSGHLFFDHGENKAGVHQCDRKQLNRKFTIEDLASIHRREFHIINSNVIREQRFLGLCENLFPVHAYETKSTHWKSYLSKPKDRRTSTSDIVSDVSLDTSEVHHINTLLTLNQAFSPSAKSSPRRSSHSRRSIRRQRTSATSSPVTR